MMTYTLDWQSYRLLPYERRLAIREVKTLTGAEPQLNEENVIISGMPAVQSNLERLTYFRQARLNGSGILVPLQAQLEAASTRKIVVPPSLFEDACKGPRLRRQSTRYSVHGLHEYKGKFNPQIVRATANLLGVGLNGKAQLLDPFCGSGTSLIEAAHMGWDAIGADINPLAIFISNAKIHALKVPTGTLEDACERLTRRLVRHIEGLDLDRQFSERTACRLEAKGKTRLPNEAYLQRWFAPSVLVQLRLISAEIDRTNDFRVRDIVKVVLSDILREVSFQDPADLRIRRRRAPQSNYPVVPLFVDFLQHRIQNVLRARELLGVIRGKQKAVLGDSRRRIPGHDGVFDAVITSPPYATALPYLDTQRLSLAFFGLLGPQELRAAENRVIGNREISRSDREREEKAIAEVAKDLPRTVIDLCTITRKLARQPGNGFRRRNVPALLLRYFRGMQDVFTAIHPKVPSNGRFAMVVGPNRTTLSGQTVVIDTPQLLGSVAETAGWRVEEVIALDAYQRFNLHRQNSIRTECLVVLERSPKPVATRSSVRTIRIA